MNRPTGSPQKVVYIRNTFNCSRHTIYLATLVWAGYTLGFATHFNTLYGKTQLLVTTHFTAASTNLMLAYLDWSFDFDKF